MVEFAVVMLLFVGTMLAMFEGARVALSAYAIANAAAEGARAGAYVPTSTLSVLALDDLVRAAVRGTTGFLGTIPDGDVTICRRTTSTAACGSTPVQSGSVIDVTVSYSFQFVPYAGGWLGQTAIPLAGYHRSRID